MVDSQSRTLLKKKKNTLVFSASISHVSINYVMYVYYLLYNYNTDSLSYKYKLMHKLPTLVHDPCQDLLVTITVPYDGSS